MSVVKLRGIMFNHNTGSMTNDAFNIRRNVNESVNRSEWTRGMINPEESPAAYAIDETSNHLITIQARFISPEYSNQTIDIRAIEPLYLGTPIPFWLWLLIIWLLMIFGQPIPFNVLGRVAPAPVTFQADGSSNTVSFELHYPLWNIPQFIRLRVIGIFHIRWRWQYRSPGGPWRDFDTSQHRIYIVLEEPKGPWSQDPTKPDLWPWTDALDYACHWAQGATSLYEAAEKITRAVNRHPLQSYTPATLFMDFTDNKYLLGSYLNKLGSGNQFSLNCTDCANAVTTLSNLLGCTLWEGRFFNMTTRKFLTLGGDPATPSDWVAWSWGYHEICWLNAIGVDERIYDGCLQVDMDNDYTDAVHVARLPVRMRFGTTGLEDYRYRLIETGTGHLENCPRRRDVK